MSENAPASKFVLRSRTVLVNAAILAAVVLLGLVDAQADGSGEFSFSQKYLPEDWQKWTLIITAAGNLLLRWLTKNGIRLRPEPTAPSGPANSPDAFRIFPPAAVLFAALSLGACAEAQEPPEAPPELLVTATEPKIAGQRMIIDATKTVADRVEFMVWVEGLPADSAGLEQFAAQIEAMRKLGADVTLPPEKEGAGYLSKFAVDGGRINLLVLDSLAGTHYVIGVAAFAAGWSDSTVIERRIPGVTPPTPPGPTPVPPQPTPPPGPTPHPPTPPIPPPVPPAPTPPTPPGPEPEPQVPEGRFKISRRVYESAKAVNSPQRAADADAIAGFLKSLAGDVESGKTRGVSQIREQYNSGMATKFNAEQKANWLGFSAVVGRIIYDLLQSGALGTWQDWVDLLLEIAAALELVL